jgi:hypothetical protein
MSALVIDGWTINKDLYTATGPYDENGYRRTIPLMMKLRVWDEPTDEQFRDALRAALKRG